MKRIFSHAVRYVSALLLVCISTLMMAGCRYQVVDTDTGRVYYTDKWVAADGYTGPLSFIDHSGRAVRLSSGHVKRISQRDYDELTAPPAAVPEQ